MDQNNNTASAIEAGQNLSAVRMLGLHPLLALPDNSTVHDLEKYLPAPLRKRGRAVLRDVASFVSFVNKEKTAATRLYGSLVNPGFHCVFDDDADGAKPGWREHEAVYACPLSIEWKTWLAMSGKQVNQEQFAQFMETNLPDIVNPPAAEMLEISRSLEAKKKVNFASGIRLSNGQNELTYEEEITGTAQKGKLSVPEIFTIGIPVLEGGAAYSVEARLRYRIADQGKLTMWFELVRPHKIVEDAMKHVRAEIADKTALEVFNGDPAGR